jgi:glycerophosphoryl diester phosphodiesterase
MLLPATAAGPADRVDAADVGGAEPPAEPPVPGGRTPFHDPGQARSGSGSGARRLGVLAGAAALVVVVALVAFTLLHNGSGSPSAKASTTPSATPSAGAALAAATAAGKPGPLAPVAHRGGWEDFPRNSLPALADAAKLGDIVQVDLLWTSDGVPILLRDETTVVRSKAGQGAPVTCTGGRLVVAKTTLSVLQSKCRTVSSASKNGKTYPIATLDQATAQVAADKGVWFYVQMAPQGLTPARTAGVLATLAKHGMIDRSVVGSFYPEALQQIRGQAEAAGENLRLMMYLPARSGDTALPSSLSLTALHLYGIAVDIGTATKSYLHSARAQHLVTMVWNANDEQQWEQARDFGVDEVFTDTPHAYQDWLQSHPTATTKP